MFCKLNDHCVIASPKSFEKGVRCFFSEKKCRLLLPGNFLEEYWETLRQSIFGALLN